MTPTDHTCTDACTHSTECEAHRQSRQQEVGRETSGLTPRETVEALAEAKRRGAAEAEARIVAYMRSRAEDWRDRDPDGAKGLRDMADELENGAHRA